MIYEYYKLNLDFPVDLRYSYSPSLKKVTEAAKKYFWVDAITHNNNLSTRKIVNLLSESELKFIVYKSPIARILNSLAYR